MYSMDRILDLNEKLQAGTITAAEVAELDQLNTDHIGPGNATDQQKSYIFDLLDKIGAEITDFTDTDWPDLNYEEASELIDTLKAEVTDERAWDEI